MTSLTWCLGIDCVAVARENKSPLVVKRTNKNYDIIVTGLRANELTVKQIKKLSKETSTKENKLSTVSIVTGTTKTAKKATVKLNTVALGKITASKLRKLVKLAGSQAALAREIGVPTSTVRNWALTLRKLNA